ncbi:MAG: hypothetical protein ACYDDS_13455 [Candidatus Sulfotelmatobacter sp.]
MGTRVASEGIVSRLSLLVHCESRMDMHHQLLKTIEEIDPGAAIKKDWDSVIGHLEAGAMNSVDLVIDVLGRDGIAGLRRLRELWQLRLAHNHSAVPLYFALSCVQQPASLRYEVRRLGGYFLYVSDVLRHFGPQLDEIRFQLEDVKRVVPHWEIVQEYFGSDPRRTYVIFTFGNKPIYVGGSDRHLAVLAVLLKNNGIPRSMKALRQLCWEDPLFVPSGGPFAVPQLATLKMYLYRDYPKYLQRAFDDARAGYCAEQIIEHIDVGAKALGFRIRGISAVTAR